MKIIKISLVAALLASSSLVADIVSDIEISGNAAITSNYVWRGMTQSDDTPTVQGGVDLAYKGVYVGLWGSGIQSTKASSEFDVYAGYAGEISKFSYDIGYIQYMYPNDTDALNFGEAYLSLGYDFDVLSVSAMYYLGVDTNDDTAGNWVPEDGWEMGVSVPLPMDISLDGTYGIYGDDNSDNGNQNPFGNYYSIGATKSFSKFDLSVVYTGMNFDDSATKDQDNVVVALSTTFDLK